MKKKKTSKSQIELLKYYALKLRSLYQIPFRLCYLITKIDKETDIRVVKYLKDATEDYLRVKNYYLVHARLENEYNKVIQESYDELLESLKEENN